MLIVITGMPAGNTGTGKLISTLKSERFEDVGIYENPELLLSDVDWYKRKGKIRKAKKIYRRYIYYKQRYREGFELAKSRENRLLIFHPQSIGYRKVCELVDARDGITNLFLLDSSFFCIKSYNYVEEEYAACLRCLDKDIESQIARTGCVDYPVKDECGAEFIKNIRREYKQGKLNLLAQNRNQAELARKSFSMNELPKWLWIKVRDFDEQIDVADKLCLAYDIVFHGSEYPAKGNRWAEKVAGFCDQVKFVFPWKGGNDCRNGYVSYKNITWETGLREEVMNAKITLVPSLWSASIEGALIKSILFGNLVCVVENETAFSSEIPEDLVIRLPANEEKAARRIKEILGNYELYLTKKRAANWWVEKFMNRTDIFGQKLVEECL